MRSLSFWLLLVGLTKLSMIAQGQGATPDRHGFPVAGIVLNAATGQPISGSTIVMRGEKAGQEATSAARTGPDGRFTVPDVPSARYSVTVDKMGFVQQSEQPEAGDSGR